MRLAEVTAEQGRFVEASELAKEALAVWPRNERATLVLANALAYLGQPSAGAELIGDLLRNHPASPDLTYAQASLLAQAGLPHEALPLADRLTATGPQSHQAHALMGALLADWRIIVTAYQHYLRWMVHWRGVISAECLLEIDYEELIRDREGVTRRIVEFAGLGWDDACLRHEANDRTVNSASV